MTGDLTSLAFCWTIERRDGAGLALTSHDRPLTIAGVRHEPAPGMTPAAIRKELGIAPDQGEVSASLSSSAIEQHELLAGLWDGAAVRLVAVDWTDPESGPVELASGFLGEVMSGDGSFSAELLGPAARLEEPVCPHTSPECRAEFGDPRCRVDLAGRSLRAAVVGVEANVVTLDRHAGDGFAYGRARFLSGAANGESRVILSVQGPALTLRSAPSADVLPGTPIELVEGCDKRLETCAVRFGNAANFRGEPRLPGNDLLTRYPGS
jgi:uncharacterized phage protein (TIGR02218 family)